MVADSLQVAADLVVGADGGGVGGVLLLAHDGGDVAGNLLVQVVDVFLSLGDGCQVLGGASLHGVEALQDVLGDHAGHAGQLVGDVVERDGGGSHLDVLGADLRDHIDVLQVEALLLLRGALRQDAGGKCSQLGAEGQEKDGGDNVEQGVHVGDLSRRVGGGPGGHDGRQGGHHAHDGEDTGTDDVEHQMDHCGPLGAAAGADGCQHGGDTGTDVLAEQHIHGGGQTHNAAVGQGLQNTHGGGGGLDQGCEACAHQDADQRVGKVGHDAGKGGGIPQRHHGVAHEVHADEQDAQAGDYVGPVLHLLLIYKHGDGHTHKGDERSHGSDVQGHQLSGDGGADVGAHDDPHCLLQGHHPGVYESHDHDGGGGGGLDEGRDAGAHQNSDETVGCEPFQNFLHLFACGSLQAVAHHLHSVEEECQAAQQVQNVCCFHNFPLHFL